MYASSANIPIYVESEQEAEALELAFKKFVNDMRNKGAVVTAKKLTRAIDTFGNNPILLTYLM